MTQLGLFVFVLRHIRRSNVLLSIAGLRSKLIAESSYILGPAVSAKNAQAGTCNYFFSPIPAFTWRPATMPFFRFFQCKVCTPDCGSPDWTGTHGRRRCIFFLITPLAFSSLQTAYTACATNSGNMGRCLRNDRPSPGIRRGLRPAAGTRAVHTDAEHGHWMPPPH